jgi:hypothetical protein
MGPERSQLRVAEHLSRSRQWISIWASKYTWVVRSVAYDSWLDRKALQARVEAIEKMEALHAQVAGGYIAAMAMPLRALTRDRAIVGEDGTITHIPRASELEKMETATLIAIAESAARTFASLTSVERLARRADDAAGMAAQAPADEIGGVPASRSLLSAEDKVVGFLGALRDAGMRVPLLDELDEQIDDAEVVAVDGIPEA